MHSCLIAGKAGAGVKRKAANRSAAEPKVTEAGDTPEETVTERTEYAKMRPRRAVATAKSTLGATAESLELVACSDFIGPPGSGSALAQPYKVEIDSEVLLTAHSHCGVSMKTGWLPSTRSSKTEDPFSTVARKVCSLMQALLTMDLHAHLSMCEIIGLLGGTWDAANRVLCIKQAFPCRQAAGSVSGTSVELDPAAEVETRAMMADLELRPVGWCALYPVAPATLTIASVFYSLCTPRWALQVPLASHL